MKNYKCEVLCNWQCTKQLVADIHDKTYCDVYGTTGEAGAKWEEVEDDIRNMRI